MRIRILLVAVLSSVLLATACRPKSDQAAMDSASTTAWSSIIAGHTNGTVSRKSAIRVLFQTDVQPVANKNQSLIIEPALQGRAEFTGKRELVFQPTGELAAGQTYTVRVLAAGLAEVPAGLAPYEFKFAVQAPQFEVSLQSLESDPADDQKMILRGLLTTADTEDAARVEKLATLSHLDKPIVLQWAHDSDGLNHRFTSSSLPRQNAVSKAVVRWDGKDIGAKNSGELAAQVPARGAFTVTDAQALETEGRRQIVIAFSDALARNQNLSGLVRLGDLQFTTRVANNLLTIYPGGEADGSVAVTLEPGIRNQRGQKLDQQLNYQLEFTSTKPQVRWLGKGVILPESATISVPFEAVSARSINVLATRIYDDNVTQFLQVNGLDGEQELGRVGRVLWRKKIDLTGPRTGRWQRYSLDVGELLRKYPRGMFQLTLQITPADSDYRCDVPLQVTNTMTPAAPPNQEDSDTSMQSNWDYVEQYYGNGGNWEKRNDPCDMAYFQYGQGTTASRNLLASNIGLLAKRDQRGQLLIMTTDLRSAKTLAGVKLSVRNYQNQQIGSATSDSNGLATLTTEGTPYLLVAEANDQRGYLKLAAGAALPVSHFDVGGETVSRGLKGFIYGDRGVWRPGDTLYLTFVLQDKEKSLPADHPVTLELYDPASRMVQSQVNTRPIGGFYAFAMQTNESAPTGNWTAKSVLGGSSFSKRLKIETVMPNRLKIALDLGNTKLRAGKPIAGRVSSQWLSGATASGLKTDVSVRLTPTATAFTSFKDYVFDDPARGFAAEPITVFEGNLDDNGNAGFENTLKLDSAPPGMLSATFTTRVFERGGAFSILRDSSTYAPFERFVGVRLPKGDAARDMLITDQDHTLEIATLDADGKPVAVKDLEVTFYKVEWRWWWDKGADSLAQYVEGQSNSVVRTGKVSTVNGRGAWKFRVNYPDWGRYLLRVCDPGGHCSGRTFYIDWPAWAGKEREQSGPAASILTVTADKDQYKVGETATVQLPESAQGRALMTIENGTRILESRWLEPKAGNTRFQIPVTDAMTPNVYVAITLVQPHEGRNNDRPLRLYGVVPLLVNDPATRLAPKLTVADEWKPESKVAVDVAETNGKAMTYTVAVVDEGLLSLTNFKTPDLHAEFYKREALGIATWDLFDQVAGSYSAQLDRLLALGGSDTAGDNKTNEKKSRFPPVVRFIGPFQLKAGAKASHQIELPQYVGAVRVMLVAGSDGAYGTADKSVFVRQPLMLLPTLPRVAGPGEEILVPVSLFVTKAGIKDVTLTLDTDGLMQPVGDRAVHVLFTKPDERIGLLRVRTGDKLGQSRLRFAANGGGFSAKGEVYIEIRSPNPLSTRYQNHVLQPGETWSTNATPFGLDGTNYGTLELSAVPPLNLDARLRYLIQYPHGCLEQTTSAAFPQLYLNSLLTLENGRKRQIEENVRAAIERLRFFQLANGAFSYWPGGSGGFATAEANSYESWSSTYATHFLIEAEKAGYTLPGSLRSGAVRALKAQSTAWTAPAWRQTQQGSDGSREALASGAAMGQMYRLYVLALAGAPDVGAMNRLRELKDLPGVETWTLAAAYKLAGLPDIAKAMTANAALTVRDSGGYETFGSPLRDRAMLLQSMVTLGRLDRSADLVRLISTQLSSESWYSTQETAYALMAMARFAGNGSAPGFTSDLTIGGKLERISAVKPVFQRELGALGGKGPNVLVQNSSQRVLFATLALRGIPAAGRDAAEASGLGLEVRYTDLQGTPIEVTRVAQGTDLIASITVRNLTPLTIDNIALTQMVPAGWEIHNDRLDNADEGGEKDQSGASEASDGIPVLRRNATEAQPDHTDIRDDRVLQYFGLRSGQTIRFKTRVNAAYVGRFYLPSISADAMYDASKFARSKGQWVQVAGQPR